MAPVEEVNALPEVQYDLTSTIAPYMDLHMMLPIIDFLEEKQIYNTVDLQTVRIQYLEPTNMVDFAMEMMHQLDGQNHEELVEKRDQVVAEQEQLREDCAELVELLNDADAVAVLHDADNFTYSYLEEHHGLTEEKLSAFYRYAKSEFECGNYSFSAFYLSYYRLLDTSSASSFSALWGKLASEILMKMWDQALEDIKILQQIIDEREESQVREPNHLEQLQLRSWLMHWSLFVFFQHENGRNEIVEFFYQEKYLNAIQTNCPWLLRYLTAAVITNKRRRNGMIKDLVNTLQQERYTYRDPITMFLEALYVDFDFELAQEKLMECEQVLSSDFFLTSYLDEFLDNARVLIFETYCRVHTKVDLGMLSERLRLSPDESERWIVDLIRNAKLDAKIDSEKNQVVMQQPQTEIYQQIIDKTSELSFRTYQIVGTVLGMSNTGSNKIQQPEEAKQ